eukprot:TRINITY_DN33576_c0_g1_i1.p1 TRINITY_DN33576_c0_g1~~TRINITY_DN33576_c0_g1_i1.p1  ORF type:complete len:147 (-),score=11.94 TRINITY_DN33576_c0_g1_i1:437-877(-)
MAGVLNIYQLSGSKEYHWKVDVPEMMPVRELRYYLAARMGMPQTWCTMVFGGRVLASNSIVASLFGLKPDVVLSSPLRFSMDRLRHVSGLPESFRLGSVDGDEHRETSAHNAGALEISSQAPWRVDTIILWDSPDGRGFVLFCHDL